MHVILILNNYLIIYCSIFSELKFEFIYLSLFYLLLNVFITTNVDIIGHPF